jgi:hypothetical protein
LPDRFAGFQLRLEGSKEALQAISGKRELILREIRDSLDLGGLRLRGRIVGSFGSGGRPRRGTGRLSRSIRKELETIPSGARVTVGVEAKVPYARILEFGGTQPARTIRPVRKKALRWTVGTTRLASVAALDFGLTRKQAFGAPRTKKGRRAEASDARFAVKVVQPARYQRPMPYFGPAFDVERPLIESDLRGRISRALKGA